METQSTRRSDRICLELPLQLSGTDCLGEGYIEEARTLVLSRHGASIVLNRKLVPDQELTLRCLSTARTADARVVGQTGKGPQGYFYGIEFLDKSADLWNIDFPPETESREGVERVLLECVSCNAWAVSYLSEVEAEVFEANRCLSRHCKTCREMGLWIDPVIPSETNSDQSQPDSDPDTLLEELLRSQNERVDPRVNLRMTACIRTSQLGDDVVTTEDVSRGGFRFKSPKRYPIGATIEAALPYARKGGSIFVVAHIEWERPLPSEGVTLYGAWYAQVRGNVIQREAGES